MGLITDFQYQSMQNNFTLVLDDETSAFKKRALAFKIAAEYLNGRAAPLEDAVSDYASLRHYLVKLAVWLAGDKKNYEAAYKNLVRMECLICREVMFYANPNDFGEAVQKDFQKKFLNSAGKNFSFVEEPLDPDHLLNDAAASSFLLQLKNEYLSIHHDDETKRPEWFRKLSSEEQKYLIRIVPLAENATSDWKLVLSPNLATVRNILGVSNASATHFTINSGSSTPKTDFKLYRIGMPTPITAKISRAEKRRVAEFNLKQYFYANLQNFIDGYEANKLGSGNGEIPVAFQSLLTPAIFDFGSFENNNTEMLEIYREAIQSLSDDLTGKTFSKDGKEYFFNILDSNQPVSGQTPVLLPTENSRRQEKIKEYLKLVGINSIPSHPNPDEIKASINSKFGPDLDDEKIALLTEVVLRYIETWNAGAALNDQRNHALWLAAFEAIIIHEIGGASVLNCKSSKDRTGLVLDCAFAMVKTFKEQGSLPSYTAASNDPIYQTYVNNFVEIRATSHQNKQAARNAFGVEALKDEPFFLNKHPLLRVLAYLLFSPVIGFVRGTLSGIDFSRRISKNPILQFIPAISFGLLGGVTGLVTSYVTQFKLLLLTKDVMTPTDVINKEKDFEKKAKLAKINKPKFSASEVRSCQIELKQEQTVVLKTRVANRSVEDENPQLPLLDYEEDRNSFMHEAERVSLKADYLLHQMPDIHARLRNGGEGNSVNHTHTIPTVQP